MESQSEAITVRPERCRRDHLAWINGDGSGYALPDDGTIMGAVGGHSYGGHSYGGNETAERQTAVARQWLSGRGEVELVNGAVITTEPSTWCPRSRAALNRPCTQITMKQPGHGTRGSPISASNTVSSCGRLLATMWFVAISR